jgi:hypothetical protein
MHIVVDRFSWRPTHLLFLAIGASVGLAAAGSARAQTAPREPLNSERIAAEFGSYGVEVLEEDSAARVSNLFSGAAEQRVCRTFAVVRYRPSDPAFRDEHAAIVAGGSIGAVFAAAGWEVRKTHLTIGSVTATRRLATLMRIAPGALLAVHVYALDVAKGGRTLEYATLAEIHHPAYLTRDEVAEIYGPADESGRPGLVADVLATTRVAIAREP